MPKFTYQPEGADERSWDINLRKLASPEAIAIERLTGMKFSEFTYAVQKGSMVALHALLFTLLRRDNPSLQLGQVQFCMDEVGWALSDAESVDMLQNLERLARLNRVTEPSEHQLLQALRASVPASEQEAIKGALDAEFDIDGEGGEPVDPTSPPSEPASAPAPDSLATPTPPG